MSRRKNSKKIYRVFVVFFILIAVIAFGYFGADISQINTASTNSVSIQNTIWELSEVPEYSSSPYVEINNNVPYFAEEDFTTEPFEK